MGTAGPQKRKKGHEDNHLRQIQKQDAPSPPPVTRRILRLHATTHIPGAATPFPLA